MSSTTHTLVFEKYVISAQISNNDKICVLVKTLSNEKQNCHQLEWFCFDEVSLSLSPKIKKSASKNQHIPKLVYFANVEDTTTGLLRPTLLVTFSNKQNLNPFVYILVLIQEKVSSNYLNKASVHFTDTDFKIKWILKPIRKLRSSNITNLQNLIMIDQSSFVHFQNGSLFHCNEDSEQLVTFQSENSDVNDPKSLLNIAYFTVKNSTRSCFIFGVYSISDPEDISDDCDSRVLKLFVKKKKLYYENSEFVDLDPSDFLSEDYGSCVSGIFINYIEEEQSAYDYIKSDILHPKSCSDLKIDITGKEKHKSNIFVVLSHGYLLEFFSGQLVSSLSLTTIYRDLNCMNWEDDMLVTSYIEGVIDCHPNRKIVVLKHNKNCIAVDLNTEQVVKHFKEVELILIGDVLNKGSDQLLLIFESIHSTSQILQWYVTDFNTCHIDNSQTEDHPSEDNSQCLPARNALHQQLMRLNISVEENEAKLQEKQNYIHSNVIRLKETCSTPVFINQENQKIKTKYSINMRNSWCHVIDNELVVGITVCNQSNRPVTRLSLSVLNKNSLLITHSDSKWPSKLDELSPELPKAASTVKDRENQVLKKLKLSITEEHKSSSCALLPQQDTVLTSRCHVSNVLCPGSQDEITLSVLLHYYPCDSDFKDSNMLIAKHVTEIKLSTHEIIHEPFVNHILHSSSSISTAKEEREFVECLDTIQTGFHVEVTARYGYIDKLETYINKICGLIYHGGIQCYIFTVRGPLYLVRLQLTLSSDFKHSQFVIYARNEEQFKWFMALLHSKLPDNVSYQLASPSNMRSHVNQFLTSASEEISTGISLSDLYRKTVKPEENFKVDFKNECSVFKFHANFDTEKKALMCTDVEKTASREITHAVKNKLRNIESINDKFIGQIVKFNHMK